MNLRATLIGTINVDYFLMEDANGKRVAYHTWGPKLKFHNGQVRPGRRNLPTSDTVWRKFYIGAVDGGSV